jgi:WD40 repeat protein
VALLGLALGLAMAVIVIGTAMAAVHIQRAEEQSAASLRESLLREAASFRLGGELGHRDQALDLLRQASTLGGSREFHARLRDELLAVLARTDIAFSPASFSNAPPAAVQMRLDERFDRIATVEQATNVVIRSVSDGALLQRLASTADPITHIERFSPGGRFLAVRQAGALRFWDLHTATPCLTHEGTNNTFAFAPTDDTVLLQDKINEAALIELPSGNERHRWRSVPPRPGHRTTGWHTLSFSPDGRMVAGASGTSPMVELMNPATGDQLRVVTNYTATATPSHAVAMGWSRHGSALAIATADGRIYNWNPHNGERRWVSSPMIAPARSVTYHPGGDWLAAICENDQMRYFDDLAQSFVFEHAAYGERIGFSPDGRRLGPLRSGGLWGWLELIPSREYVEFRVGEKGFRLDDARFSADGRLIATGHSDDVFLIDRDRGTRLRHRSDWRMSACVFHPTRDELFVGGADGLIRYRHSFSKPGSLSFSAAETVHAGSGWQAFDFSDDARFLAAFNVRSNATFVFDQTFTNRLAVLGPMANVGAVAVSPDGRWVVTGANVERTTRLWDVARGHVIQTVTVGPNPRGTFSADGRWLAISGGWGFDLFETGTWKSAPPLPLPSGRPLLRSAAFSPDGRLLAVVINQFTVQLIDLQTFESKGTLRPPGNTMMRGLSFSPDGSHLTAVGPEARVAVWDLKRIRQQLETFGVSWNVP